MFHNPSWQYMPSTCCHQGSPRTREHRTGGLFCMVDGWRGRNRKRWSDKHWMFPVQLTAPTQAICKHQNTTVLGSMATKRKFLIWRNCVHNLMVVARNLVLCLLSAVSAESEKQYDTSFLYYYLKIKKQVNLKSCNVPPPETHIITKENVEINSHKSVMRISCS